MRYNHDLKLFLYPLLVHPNPVLHGHFGAEFGDKFIWNIVHVLKSNTAFAHIQFSITVFGILRHEPV